MARVSLHSHDVALLQVQVVHIMIISLAGILELHLHEVGALSVSWYVGEPVIGVQLSVLSAHSLITEPSVASMKHSEFHILVVHDVLYFNL